MEYQKAKEQIDNFIDVLNTIKLEALSSIVNKEARQKADVKINELQKEINRLKPFERKFNILNNNSDIKICVQCDGLGGGVEGDEYSGFNQWECDYCQGKGVL